jgi:hypothetical protein
MRARLTLILAVACAALVPVALAPAAPSPSKPVIGIADQVPAVFSDPHFQELGLTHARIDLAWDVLRDAGQRAPADAYMQSAHDHNVDVLVTFDRSRRAGRASVNPTPAQFAAELKAMRKRWPWVHEFSTWNEVNIGKRPATVANWWLALTKACPSCTILGADLLDRSATSASPSAVANSLRIWIDGFLEATGGRQPTVWGLHNYIDANNGRTTVTRAVLSLVKGRIWFTETGGLVSRHNGSKFKIPQGLAHAAATTKFILTRLDAVSLRVDRSYLYQWTKAGTTWDSAFTDGHGQPRASLSYLRQFLGR